MPLDSNRELVLQKALDVAASFISNNPQVSEIILRQAMRVDPDNPKVISLLGMSLQNQDKCQEAVALLEPLIERADVEPDWLNNLALSYAQLEYYEKSIELLENAIKLNPSNYLFLNNLALQYRQSGRFNRAVDVFRKALDIHNSPMVWCNLGGVYADSKMWEESERCYRSAIECDNSLAAPHVFLAYIHGTLGRWQEAFEEYEYRFNHFDQLQNYKRVYDKTKQWHGENVAGKRFLLYGEQGLGDQIQYVRYVQNLKQRGAITVVHCGCELANLFKSLPYIDEVFTQDISQMPDGALLSPYDFQSSLISLPYLLKDFDLVGSPYVWNSDVLPIKSLPQYSQTYNVGIAWAGSPLHPNDSHRSMHVKHFKALDMKGITLFNLQVGSSARIYSGSKRKVDFAEGGGDIKLVDLKPFMTDFRESARIIGDLDLIITVDTSLAHLAGAMGRPCWVLLPYNSDWRWETGNTTRWYNSIRLFRQKVPGDWKNVMQEVRESIVQCLS